VAEHAPARCSLTITDALLPDGTITSVRIVDGIVAARGVPAAAGDTVHDAHGRLLLPAMAEAHAHLDKAFLSETVPNPTGDLMGAILAMEAHRGQITEHDTCTRAERAARIIAHNGATAIRTHADLTAANGLSSVRALLEVKRLLQDLVHVEVYALCGWPSIGPEGAEQRALLRDAIALGVDGIGGCPHLETDPIAANESFLSLAADAGLPLDLHTDETLDPGRLSVEDLAERVLASGFAQRVAASHCVSLGMQPEVVQARIAEKLAAAEISVIALPSSNLFLQGREHRTGTPRALTAVAALRSAGVNVAAGADNLQDPFNPVGRADCLETAGLMVVAGHVLPDDAYTMVSGSVRRLMGLPEAGSAPGQVADLVLLHARSARDGIAFAHHERCVIRGGRIVAGA
jgi:cytosine deaminase